jgi:predicted hydrocarbon binding protein
MSLRPNSDGRRPNRVEFIAPKNATGALENTDAHRFAVLPASFLSIFSAELAQPLNDQTRHALYRSGYEWALQDMVSLSHQLLAEFGNGANFDLWQMDAKFVLDRWWASFNSAGWGACTLDLSALSRGISFVELRNGMVEPSNAGTTQPSCHLYAGLFAGALSFFERIERHAVEVQCVALGAASCRFVVGPGPQIDEVEAWRQQRIAPDEIRRRLS